MEQAAGTAAGWIGSGDAATELSLPVETVLFSVALAARARR